MRKLNATRRLSGHKMATINIRHHVSLDDISKAIVSLLLDADKLKLDRSKVWKEVRRNLEYRGSDWFPEGPDVEAMGTMPRRLAERLFPEFI